MISVLVYLALATVAFSLLALATYKSNEAQTIWLKSTEYASEILMVKKSLLVLSTTYKETIEDTTITYPALPVGVNQGAFHTLPAVLMKPVNPLGQPYVYCPSAARSDQPLTESINRGPGLTYNVGKTLLVKNGTSREYVTSSGLNTLNGAVILAYIISPNPLFKGSTNCKDVTFDEQLQKFVVAGGRVETITAIEVEAVNLQ